MAPGKVRRLDASVSTYAQFVEVMMDNQPAILSSFGGLLPSFWPWQSEGRANVDFLRREFGDMVVPVVECSSNGYGEQRQRTMTLSEYLDIVNDGRQTQVQGGGGPRGEKMHGGDGGDHGGGDDDPIFYLKDWHFQGLKRDGAVAGAAAGAAAAAEAAEETPFFFGDDWLNWWCDSRGQEDYRFVYIGPSASWTPLHHDVLNSYSWSFNICGRKRWILFPPEATPDLYDRHGRDLATDVRVGRVDVVTFPRLEEAPRLEILQEPGEAIFVPSGWHHQVINVGDGSPFGGLTISVNTNWFNGFNLARVHSFLLSELSAVREALGHLREIMSEGEGRRVRQGGSKEDEGGQEKENAGVQEGTRGCRTRGGEWERQCELAMRTNSGLNMTDFAQIVLARTRFLLPHRVSPGGAAPPASVSPDRTSEARINGRCEQRTEESTSPIVPATVSAAVAAAEEEEEEGGEGGIAWHEEQWRMLALEQIRLVLRDLLVVAPCASHIFLDDDAAASDLDGSTSGATDGNGPDWSVGNDASDRGASAGAARCSLRETLASVEAYIAGGACNGAEGGDHACCRLPASVALSNCSLEPPDGTVATAEIINM